MNTSVSSTPPCAEDPGLRRDSWVIALVGYAHGVSHFFHLVIPVLFPWLMEEFALSYTHAGLLVTVFFIVSGVGQALSGFLVDRYGAQRILLLGLALLALSGVVLALAGSYAWLMVAAFCAGAGNSVFHPADFTLLNRLVSPPRLGPAFATHGLTGNLGWALAPPLVTFCASVWDWRDAALLAAVIAFSALVLVVFWHDALKVPPHETTDRASAGRSHAFAFLRLPVMWLCFLFFFTLTIAFGALQNFLPSVLQSLYGVSQAVATTAQTVYLLAGALGMAFGGYLAARVVAQERIIAVMLSIAALFGVTAAFGAVPVWALPGLFAFMGFAAGTAGPSRDLLVRQTAAQTLGPQAFGRVYGFVYSGLDAGLALAPLLFAPLLDRGYPAGVLVGVAIFQGLALLTALWVGRHAHPAMVKA